MKFLVLSVLLLNGVNTALSQEIKIAASYNYLFAPQWDKAIQTYNFSRPFITEKQPLLVHGWNVSSTYLFKSSNNLKQGIHLGYTNTRSTAKNAGIENTNQLHLVYLGYVLHLENPEKWKGFYGEVIFSAVSSGVFRRENGEPYTYDDARAKAFGIGGDISLKMGYALNRKGKTFFSPFVALGYAPYLFSPNTEAVLNQTKTLVGKNWTMVFNAQAGLTFHLRK